MQRINTVKREQWNAFVAANSEDGGVLQSWEWGEFQQSLGRRIWRLAFGKHDLEAVCLLVEHQLPFGYTYCYAPRGPVIKNSNSKFQIPKTLHELEKFARERGAMFLRIEPPYQQVPATGYPLRVITPIQPAQTLRIDLTPSKDQHLSTMHQKTRYNIRLAEKKGVQVTSNEKRVTSDIVDSFWALMQVTAKRDGFTLHAKKHYEGLLKIPYCFLLTASCNDVPLATALVAFFWKTAYYLHGASANDHREVMAPYALHWHIMEEAKRRGCETYDLWGVDERKWPGVTRFKRGFAPETPITEYVGSYDVPLRPLYSLYRIWKLFR